MPYLLPASVLAINVAVIAGAIYILFIRRSPQ